MQTPELDTKVAIAIYEALGRTTRADRLARSFIASLATRIRFQTPEKPEFARIDRFARTGGIEEPTAKLSKDQPSPDIGREDA